MPSTYAPTQRLSKPAHLQGAPERVVMKARCQGTGDGLSPWTHNWGTRRRAPAEPRELYDAIG